MLYCFTFDTMKKCVAILLLSLYLLSTTEAHQLLKLPSLVQHYFQHKAENNNLTLLSFLNMHYAETVVYDDDYAQDMQLPFKTHAENFCVIAVPSLPAPKFEMNIVVTPVVKQTIPIINDPSYSFLSTQDIFQPPKSV